jgi:thiol-disulfide isomerase/thioredoxin
MFGSGSALTLLLAVVLAGRAPTAGDPAAPVDYAFRRPPINDFGIASLADLRGKPVLIEFWGTRCAPCVRSAVPASLALQETHGDDLQVVFVEAQGSPQDEIERFALARKWLGGRALWTSEAPVQVAGNGLPKFALLDRGGRLILSGNPIGQAREIERLVQEEIRSRRVPPADVPKALRPAWTDFLKGEGERALERLDALEAGAGADAQALLEATRAARAAFHAAWSLRFARIERLVDAGQLEEARAQAAELGRTVAGIPGLAERLQALRQRLELPESRAEAEVERALARIVGRFHASAGDPAVAHELRSFAERHPGTRAAARAERLAGLVSTTGR